MKIHKSEHRKYIFVGKTLFFHLEKIVVIGDMHLGYEEMLKRRGLDINLNQTKELLFELENTLKHIKTRYGKIENIIFLGDVKHYFGFMAEEKKDFRELMKLCLKYVENENRIILIRGNHEKNEKSGRYTDYFIVKDIAFIHGHKEFLEMYSKEINLVVMGHLHPSVILEDEMKIKREKYKCFLVGRFKKKDFVIVPSFLNFTFGVSANEFKDMEEGYDFCIIPEKELENFEVYVCASELGEETLDFGKLKNIY